MSSIRNDDAFSPTAYRKAIADMFGALDQSAQRDFAERIAILPRHIHSLATKGQIAIDLPRFAPAVAT